MISHLISSELDLMMPSYDPPQKKLATFSLRALQFERSCPADGFGVLSGSVGAPRWVCFTVTISSGRPDQF